ncbi:MAG TPA: DUF3052 family protein [Gemmatimonadaceae bacterium]|nr:DUF3052 family protein [Gemmatimonadaceae bacterium]
MAGYSGTPLAQKLGITPGRTILLSHAPKDYLQLVAPLPDGVRIVSRLTGDTDIVHLFATKKGELAKALRSLRRKLRQDGAVWVSWPKKAARVPTDITEDTIREVALPMGFVDVKVCAIDEQWSGLKLVIRKELRTRPA